MVYNDILLPGEIDIFQLVMLGVHAGMQLMVIFLGIHVMRIPWYLWHCEPGTTYTDWVGGETRIVEAAEEWHEHDTWHPQIERIVLEVMRNDIRSIVMDYCRNIQLDNHDEYEILHVANFEN